MRPVIFEQTSDIGGISKTVNYKGNRLDIGGHRFFSKSDRVMKWWLQLLPQQSFPSIDEILLKMRPQYDSANGPNPEKTDRVMLLRKRISRIFFLRRFFDYPISLNFQTVSNLGLARLVRIGISYILVRLRPIKNEKSLEDFFVNRFGRELYETFFKDYTHKVWGVPCSVIKPEWGGQRVKGLSITKTILHALKKCIPFKTSNNNIETSLIEQFFYPKLGPGQFWEFIAAEVTKMGGEIHFNTQVKTIYPSEGGVQKVIVTKTRRPKKSQQIIFFLPCQSKI
ncbi:MAG: hypothetical protein WCG27_12570 [Pseudomonadota bacterium]